MVAVAVHHREAGGVGWKEPWLFELGLPAAAQDERKST